MPKITPHSLVRYIKIISISSIYKNYIQYYNTTILQYSPAQYIPPIVPQSPIKAKNNQGTLNLANIKACKV